MQASFPWKYVIKIASVALLVQYSTNDVDYVDKLRDKRAPTPFNDILGTFEVRGDSGVSAIHAVLQPNGNIFLFGRFGPGGLVISLRFILYRPLKME
jgi:hypothetical protein